MLEGLPPNNAAHVMRLYAPEVIARRVADIIVETFDPAETAAAAFEEAGGGAENARVWTVEVFFGEAPDEDLVRGLIAAVSDAATASGAGFARVSERDWVAASLDGLDAVREGRILVHGSHARNQVKPGDIAIEIEAALAFGTGHHGTTRGCLREMNAIARRRRPRRILDVGTGTGVLAIAASRRFRRTVKAGDIDPVAVATARENVRGNGAARWVRPVRATGLGHAALREGAPYDLVFCNIIARPLRALAPALKRVMAPGGEVVLSGLLASDVAGVISAYRSQGFGLVRRRDLDNWATLVMRRPFSSS